MAAMKQLLFFAMAFGVGVFVGNMLQPKTAAMAPGMASMAVPELSKAEQCQDQCKELKRPTQLRLEGDFLKRDGEEVIMELPSTVKCDPLEHLLVINVEGEGGQARRDHIYREFEKGGLKGRFNFWPAVNFKNSTRLAKEMGRKKCPCTSTVGCGLSHREIYEMMLYEKWACATIFEDDVGLATNFSERVAATTDSLPPFDVILWGFCPGGTKPRHESKDLTSIPKVKYGWPGSCVHAYTVSLQGAYLLTSANTPVRYPPDGAMDGRHWHKDLRPYIDKTPGKFTGSYWYVLPMMAYQGVEADNLGTMGFLQKLRFWKKRPSNRIFPDACEAEVTEVKQVFGKPQVAERGSTPGSSPSESTCCGSAEHEDITSTQTSDLTEEVMATITPEGPELIDFEMPLHEIAYVLAAEFGPEVAHGLQSSKWDQRQRALQMMSCELKGTNLQWLPPGAWKCDRQEAWRVSCQVLGHVLKDKVIPVQLAALQLFRDAFENIDAHVTAEEVQHALDVLLDPVMQRLGDSNVRLHEAAQSNLVFARYLLGDKLLYRLRHFLERWCGYRTWSSDSRAWSVLRAGSAPTFGFSLGRPAVTPKVRCFGATPRIADLQVKLEKSGVTKVVTSPSYWLSTAAVLLSGILGGDLLAALMVASCAVLGGLFGRRTPLGRAMTGPVCAMSFGVMVASQMPVPGAVLRRLQFISVTLATPLLLLSCNLQELRGPSTRRLLCAFALGSFSTAIAALSSALLLKSRLSAVLGGWEMACQAISALASKNIGSGMNFIAVAQALHMKPLIIAASLAVDSALGVFYFPLAASLTPKNPACDDKSQAENADVATTSSRKGTFIDCASTFLVALAIAFLSHQFSPPGYACITSSVLAVLLATLPNAGEHWPAGEVLGWPLLYIYFAAAGFTVPKPSPTSQLATVAHPMSPHNEADYFISRRKQLHDIKTGHITTMEQQKARSQQRNGLGIALVGRLARIL
eukprot:symbB.v1.2.018640.t1/scaffold1496.1/size115469/4